MKITGLFRSTSLAMIITLSAAPIAFAGTSESGHRADMTLAQSSEQGTNHKDGQGARQEEKGERLGTGQGAETNEGVCTESSVCSDEDESTAGSEEQKTPEDKPGSK